MAEQKVVQYSQSKEKVKKAGMGKGHFFSGRRKGADSAKCNGSCNGGSCK